MKENKFKVQTSAGNVMAGVFWDSEGILLGEFLKRSATVNSERYVRILKKMKHRILNFQPNRQTDVSSPHSPLSPDLASSVFHLFGSLKFTFRESRLADYDDLEHNVREER
jgi:hypothetical protein